MRFLDLFAGIGGFRLALEQAGHKCIGFCEIDKFARQTYKANFGTEGEVEWHDITTVTNDDVRSIGRVDIITAGFPCQAFSIAGKREGFQDTRGTLFFEIVRFARILKPKYLLLENVRGLLSHDNGNTFETILHTLGELGYWVEWQIFNSKNFGVPQHRERVFIIGHLGGEPRRKVFPITRQSKQTIKQIGNIIDTESFGGNPQRGRVYSPDGLCPSLNTMQGGGLEPKIMMIDDSFSKQFGGTAVYEGYSPTLRASGASSLKVAIPVLTPERENKRQNGRRFKEDGDPMFTITSQDRHGVAVSHGELIPRDIAMTIDANYHKGFDNRGGRTGVLVSHKTGVKETEQSCCLDASYYKGLGSNQERAGVLDGARIRRLTPLECFRLQGFPDSHHDNAKAAGVSDSQLYKQAGNAVTVNVVEVIARRLT